MSICSFIGLQPKDFPWNYGNSKAHVEYMKTLRQAIAVAVERDGIDEFVCGLINSADLDFAETVISFKKKKYSEIRLVCIVDSQNQRPNWNRQNHLRYDTILKEADGQQNVLTAQVYQYLVDNAEQIIFAWDEQPNYISRYVQYAIQKDKFTYFIRLNDIKDDVYDPNEKAKREAKEREDAAIRNTFARIAAIILLQELINTHPDPKNAVDTAINNNPTFRQDMLRLVDNLEIDKK